MTKREVGMETEAALTAQILRDAAALIDGGWCQNSYAVREDGEAIHYDETDAVAFCARGAVCRAARDLDAGMLIGDACEVLLAQIAEDRAQIAEDEGYRDIIDWNDAKGRSVGDVQLAFKKAVADAEAGRRRL